MIKKITLALLLLVLAVGAAGYVYIEQIEKQNAEDIQQLQSRVNSVRHALSKKVTQWRESVNALASDQELINSIDGGEQEKERIERGSRHKAIPLMTGLNCACYALI